MNDKTVLVLKNIIKKWVREYNILDGCLELEKNKIAELKAENDRLKSQLDFEVQKKEVLEAENEQLKEKIKNFEEVVKLCRCEQYQQTLQEIKEICKETCRKRCTNDCLGTKKHCGYGQILRLITKAESEEV